MKTPSLILHVNYVEQGQSIREICSKAVDWGYDGVEFRRQRSGIKEDPERYIDEIASAVGITGLKQVFFGRPGVDLAQEALEAREQEIQELMRFLKLAATRLPFTIYNMLAGAIRNSDPEISDQQFARHGSYAAEDKHWKQTVEGMSELAEYGKTHGLRFAFETHMIYLHDLPEITLRLVEMINHPCVGINLDYGNTVYFPGIKPLHELIPLLGANIFYVHLKNSIAIQGERVPTSLADGEINHRQYLKLLSENNYSGPICLEAPRAGDRELFAQQDIKYIRSMLNEFQWN